VHSAQHSIRRRRRRRYRRYRRYRYRYRLPPRRVVVERSTAHWESVMLLWTN
jgi:hypothetical protein